MAPALSATAFAALSMEEQAAGLGRLAARALAAWDLVDPSVSLIKYRENAVFAVADAAGRRAVLRVHRPRYRSHLDLLSEFAWIRELASAGIEAPGALPARDGRLVVEAADEGVPEPRQCDLLEWVDGTPPGTLEGGVAAGDDELHSLYATVGSLAARMHEHARSWRRPEPFSRPSWNLETLVGEAPTFGRFEELDVVSPDQMPVLVRARDLVRRRLAMLGPADTLIHGDLVPDNILVDGAASRLIDFDDFGWSWVGFEIATSLFPLTIGGGFEAGLAGFVEGYRRVAPLGEDQLGFLPDLLMARSLSYLGWPVGRPEIASARDLAPMFAMMLAAAADDYLSTTAA